MTPEITNIVGSVFFAIAVIHVFAASHLAKLAHKFAKGSVPNRTFHLLSEVEVVFGFWSGIFLAYLWLFVSFEESARYLESLSFTEPIFVFVIMVMASTRPVIAAAEKIITLFAAMFPSKMRPVAFFFSALTFGPLIGSLITEPAAMTVTALILYNRYFKNSTDEQFKYLVIGALFVNVSIGGVLTHFAAPPVVMVAGKWGWTTPFMFANFGWRAIIGVIITSLLLSLKYSKHIKELSKKSELQNVSHPPVWMSILYAALLGFVIVTSHVPAMFVGFFLFFLGVTTVTQHHHSPLKLREGLLVGFFLAGLVVLGSTQSWWLEKLFHHLSVTSLFFGATALTAVFDNAALTFLGSQVPGIDDAMKYALMAGAVTGGGLTVIANAPNPAGFTILRDTFKGGVISPLYLFLGATIPTIITMICFWWIP